MTGDEDRTEADGEHGEHGEHGEERGDARWVRITTCSTVFEAEQIRNTLDGAGIPVFLRGLQPGVFGPGFQGVIPGGIDVCVPSPELSAARALVGDEY